MRNKTEFEARVRELAAAKQEVSKKKQKKIRSFTIAGGVLVCAACCVIVFTRIDIKMDGIKNKAPENSMEHLGIENKTEEAANSGNSVQQNTPGYSMGNSVMEDTIINESYVSIMREENFDGGTSRAVLLSGDNENAACLIEWIDSVKLNELSGEKETADITYNIMLTKGNASETFIIMDNCIKKDDEWYSFSAEAEETLAEILDKCFR